MPIVGLKDRETLLKSLKFGRDVRGGGDSGQPYIKSALPGDGLGSDALNSLTRNSFGDFPIRGNTAAVIKTAEDTIRIGKFSTSFLDGLKVYVLSYFSKRKWQINFSFASTNS